MIRLDLEIVNRSRVRVPRAYLDSWVKRMSKLVAKSVSARKIDGRTLIIAFVDKKEIRRLNKTYRGRDSVTDVLSFESIEEGVLGELAICPQVIASQAKEHGLSQREELSYMVLHGFLHLLGFDHEQSEREAKKMFSLQDAVFEKLHTR